MSPVIDDGGDLEWYWLGFPGNQRGAMIPSMSPTLGSEVAWFVNRATGVILKYV